MKKILLERSDLAVSPICLGAMYFGSKTNKEISAQVLNKYISAGGNFIDTANIYAHWIDGCRGGESEIFLGEWVKKNKSRGELVIATKVGIEYPGVERGLSSNQIITECEKSLKRLSTDFIDIYYAHADDNLTPIDETLRAFDDLKKDGKIRYAGASNYSADRFQDSIVISRNNNLSEFLFIQQRHSYLRPSADFNFNNQIVLDNKVKNICEKEKIQILAYSPLLSGFYSGNQNDYPQYYFNDENLKRMKLLEQIAVESGITKNQIVLNWMINSIPPVIPVVGVSSSGQLEENLSAVEKILSAEHLQLLNQDFF